MQFPFRHAGHGVGIRFGAVANRIAGGTVDDQIAVVARFAELTGDLWTAPAKA